MNTLVDDKYMTVSEDNGVLSLVWKKETTNFTDEDFKKEANKFIKVVQNQKSKNILVDMRSFRYSLSEGVVTWRKANVISVYNKLGVKKFAFISKKPAVKQDAPENTFVTKTFTSEKEGIKWLTLKSSDQF